ncbi:Cdc73p, partial [Ascoidea rubescens DSM 1968]
LILLRDAILEQKEIQLLDENDSNTNDITLAAYLKIDQKICDLTTLTNFIVENTKLSLKVIYQSWVHRDSAGSTYLSDSQLKNIKTLSFQERSDLNKWLKGELKVSAHIRDINNSNHDNNYERNNNQNLNRNNFDSNNINDSFTNNNIYENMNNERTIVDHNTYLHGSKPIDFGYLVTDIDFKIIENLKKKSSSNSTSFKDRKRKNANKMKDPIILISPASSSIITMGNIKSFLEDGVFSTKDPISSTHNYLDLLKVTRNSKNFGRLKFLVVNSTEKFTKPQYWDRVVAVFTTGQEWQFKNYKWNNPNDLFSNIKGYYFGYKGDMVPEKVNKWNVEKIELERYARFKDRQVVEWFWQNLEKNMLSKGW